MKILRASVCLCTISSLWALAQVQVPWTAETTPIPSGRAGDMAIVSPGWIVGTDPLQNGLFLWEPSGQFHSMRSDGLLQSADAVGSWVVVSSTTANGLVLYQSTALGLTPLEPPINVMGPHLVAMEQVSNGSLNVWVDTLNQEIEQWNVSASGTTVSATWVGATAVAEPPLGLAVDTRTHWLYAALPSHGILAVAPEGGTRLAVSLDAGTLGPRVNGIDVYLASDGSALLFSGSSGGVSVHRMSGAAATFVGTFHVVAPGGGSALGEIQYVDVFQDSVPGFPQGVLAVKDALNAHYTLVALDAVQAALPFPGEPVPQIDGGLPTSDGGVPAARDAGMLTGRPPGASPSAEPLVGPCGCSGAQLGGPFVLALVVWARFKQRRGLA